MTCVDYLGKHINPHFSRQDCKPSLLVCNPLLSSHYYFPGLSSHYYLHISDQFSVQMHVDNAVDVLGLLGHMQVSNKKRRRPGEICHVIRVRLVVGNMSFAAVVARVRQAVQSGQLNSMLADLGAAGLAVILLNMSGCLNVCIFSYYSVCVSGVPQPYVCIYIYIYICRYCKFQICQEIPQQRDLCLSVCVCASTPTSTRTIQRYYYMCPHATIFVLTLLSMCLDGIVVLLAPHIPHAAYVSLYYYIY